MNKSDFFKREKALMTQRERHELEGRSRITTSNTCEEETERLAAVGGWLSYS